MMLYICIVLGSGEVRRGRFENNTFFGRLDDK